MAGASSDISEEMIKLSFLECFQITIFLCYSFVTSSSVFCFLFFFFFKVQSKIGVRIIHGCALYTGKYGSPSEGEVFIVAVSVRMFCSVETVSLLKDHFRD